MSTHKKIDRICIAVIFLMLVLTVLFMNGKSFGVTPIVSAEAGGELFTANDLNADWNSSSATKIILSDKGSTINGNGAYVYDGDVCIVSAGCYVLTGELTNGSVRIDAEKNDKIWLLLDGVTIHCDDDAAIRIEQADKVFLTLADGTESTISAGAQYHADVIASGVDGVIYSRDDLTINGTGALVVNAAYQHGIVCNDDLAITDGTIAISAVQDGIHANDSVRIREAAISISAGDDGITVSNDDETAFLYVESGSITITDCYEGLEAIDITIAGGTIDIKPVDDGINACGSGKNAVLRIMGGDIRIINDSGRDADGLDSNGDIYIEGGRVFISVSDTGGNCAIDYGSENGGECVVNGGTVIACGSSMMAEGFDAASTQGFLVYSKNAAAGAVLSLEDSSGRELLSEEIPCSFSHVVLSTPDLNVGDVCTIGIDGEEEQLTVDNVSSSAMNTHGMFGGGMRQGNPSQENRQHFSGGRGMEPSDGQEWELPEGEDMEPFDGQGMERPDGRGMELPEGEDMEPFDGQGMERPDGRGMELPGGEEWELPDGQEFEPPNGQGMESPDGQEFEPPSGQGMELPDGQEMELPDGQEMEPRDGQGMESPEERGMEPLDRTELPDGESWQNRQKMQEVGGMPAESGDGQGQGDGSLLILLGISALVLSGGLVFAIKAKY